MSDIKKIQIDIPQNYQISNETPNDFQNSPFSKTYIRAIKLLESIITEQKKSVTSNGKKYDAYNNIIAFTGERGIGKSSTMLSFLNALSGDKTSSFFKDNLGEESLVSRVNFLSLEVIDPSLFRGNESIFEMVLAQMFKKFKQTLEESTKKIDDDLRRNLILSFQRVYDTFKITKKDNREIYTEESLDNLVKLSKGSNLRISFDELVECYLNCIGGKRKNKLIITIDDFDLKIKGIHDMLEDIRQLLINDNIVIFIAYKKTQLQEVIKRDLSKQTEEISSKLYRVDLKEIQEQTNKYLEKLLPSEHQLPLLSLNHYEIESYLSKAIKYDIDTENDDTVSAFKKADTRVIAATYLKQGLFIRHEDYSTSILYNPNLRSLNELLKSIDSSFEIFAHYIQNSFYLSAHQKWSESLWTSEPELINKITLDYLKGQFGRYITNLPNDTLEEKRIRNSINNLLITTNYSLIQFADIVAIIKIIQDRIAVTDKAKFQTMQYIKLCYNIRRLQLSKININYIKESSLSGIISSSFLDDANRISRKQSTNEYRDYFSVNTNLKSSILKLDKNHSTDTDGSDQGKDHFDGNFLQTFLVETINKGILKNNLYTKKNIYSFGIDEIDDKTLNFTFNIYKPFNYSSIKNSQIIELIKSENKYYYLFQNIDFVIEFYNIFIEQLDRYSKNKLVKLSDDKYSKILLVLYDNALKDTFIALNKRYPFLNLEVTEYIDSHDFFKMYLKISDTLDSDEMNNKLEISNIIDDYFRNQSNNQNFKNLRIEDLDEITDPETISPIITM